MTSSVLYSAGAKLTVDASHKFWLTGGELTTASRIQLAGPTKKTSLYDIAKDAWTESIDLPIAIAGHCLFAIKPNKIVFAGGYKDDGLLNMNSMTFDANYHGFSKVTIT